jgi:ABC-type glycerol-3-phosphate transport system permease component
VHQENLFPAKVREITFLGNRCRMSFELNQLPGHALMAEVAAGPCRASAPRTLWSPAARQPAGVCLRWPLTWPCHCPAVWTSGLSRAQIGDRIFVLGGKLLAAIACWSSPYCCRCWRSSGAVSAPKTARAAAWVAARELLTSANFHWLLGNSLKVSLSVAIIVVPLAYLFAYALQRTLIPGKTLWRGLSLLPLMAPSMLPGIALVYLFGNQGLLRGLLSDNIYGFWGIVLGEVIYTFPHALMILLSALSLADARLFDAASSMGASPARAFRSITWPGDTPGRVRRVLPGVHPDHHGLRRAGGGGW